MIENFMSDTSANLIGPGLPGLMIARPLNKLAQLRRWRQALQTGAAGARTLEQRLKHWCLQPGSRRNASVTQPANSNRRHRQNPAAR